jgi:methylated-DNA-[protein]-cysteine S-methyltransferase
MPAIGLTLFDTPLGTCGIAWGEERIAGVQLPEKLPGATRARLQRRYPAARASPPPPRITDAIEGIVALIAGEARDLSPIPLDLDGVPPFHRRVYEVARTIPAGATLTYGEIALRLGEPGAARAVGQALGQNPVPIIVPCHRVLAAGGRTGGFSARGGVATKLRLLSIEAVHAKDPPGLFGALPLAARPAHDPG